MTIHFLKNRHPTPGLRTSSEKAKFGQKTKNKKTITMNLHKCQSILSHPSKNILIRSSVYKGTSCNVEQSVNKEFK